MGRPRKMTEEKRLNVKLESAKHERFQLACEASGTTMSAAVEDFVDRYTALYLPPEKPEK